MFSTSLLIGMLSLTACGSRDPGAVPAPLRAADLPSDVELLSDVTEEVGLDFVHFNGMSGELYFMEMMGPGGAFLDYDNDGDLDIYLPQGHMLGPGKTVRDALFPPHHPEPFRDRLYRNDLVVHPDGARELRFTDVTDICGIDARGYGMGVATGDINNDGFVDLYVTNVGPNQMFINNGDGTFRDAPEAAGAQDRRWSSSATFLDYDRDGHLDLFVTNYVLYSLETDIKCYDRRNVQDYCDPNGVYAPAPDSLFRNRGDGTFEDVSVSARTARVFGTGLGVVAADFNGDGWIDIYVANDGMPNPLWINQQDGTFEDESLLAGVAVNAEGTAEASMGVEAADFDGDGDEDLFMTHYMWETNTFYVNDGHGLFEDRTNQAGLAAASLPFTSFGTAPIDLENDGLIDLLVVNGAVVIIDDLASRGDPYPIHQLNNLFRGLGDLSFVDIAPRAGAALARSEVSRGAAAGDVDNDGDLDALIINNNGPARLLLNRIGNRNHWIALRMLGRDVDRDMLGTRVAVVRGDGVTLWRRVHTDGSYCSSHDPRVVVGLGDSDRVTAVRAHWPGGRVEEWNDLEADTWTTLREGSGRTIEQP